MAKHSPQILALARKGAETRFRELMEEARMLVSSFPHLRDAFDPDELPISFIVAEKSGQLERSSTATESPTGRRMSASARKAASLQLSRYWAARRKEGKA